MKSFIQLLLMFVLPISAGAQRSYRPEGKGRVFVIVQRYLHVQQQRTTSELQGQIYGRSECDGSDRP